MITQKNISLTVVLLFLALMNVYGQEILPRELEREIKTSGKYYFGECADFDEIEAKSCALNELTQAVIVSLMQQALSEKKDNLMSDLEMRANTARVQMTGRIKILAWIEKDKLFTKDSEPKLEPQPQPVSEPNKGINPIAEPTPQPQPQPVPQPEPQPEPVPIPQPEPQPMQQPEPDKGIDPLAEPTPQPAPEPISSENSSLPVFSDPIVQNLASSGTFSQFQRYAENLKRQGKIIYGIRKTAFLKPDNCYIAVFSSGTMIALLGEGNSSRVNFLTGETIQNPEQFYNGNQIIWIQIN